MSNILQGLMGGQSLGGAGAPRQMAGPQPGQGMGFGTSLTNLAGPPGLPAQQMGAAPGMAPGAMPFSTADVGLPQMGANGIPNMAGAAMLMGALGGEGSQGFAPQAAPQAVAPRPAPVQHAGNGADRWASQQHSRARQ